MCDTCVSALEFMRTTVLGENYNVDKYVGVSYAMLHTALEEMQVRFSDLGKIGGNKSVLEQVKDHRDFCRDIIAFSAYAQKLATEVQSMLTEEKTVN